MRLDVLEYEEADLAMAWRYFVATSVRVSSADTLIDLYPTDLQI